MSQLIPELVERSRLDAGLVNGVDAGALVIGEGGDAVITFVSEVAAYRSILGVYLIDGSGGIGPARVIFADTESAVKDPNHSGKLDGSGLLTPGDSVRLSDLFDASQLQPDTRFGLFLVADGARLNPIGALDTGSELRFVNSRTGADATLADDGRDLGLLYRGADGLERTVEGAVHHTADGSPGDPARNALNVDGVEHVVSGRAALTHDVVSGDGWLSTTEPGRNLEWTTVGYDDSAWRDAYNPYPVGDPADRNAAYSPAAILGPTGAEFMWHWPSDAAPTLPGADGPDVAYFRYAFDLNLTTGGPIEAMARIAADDAFDLYVNGEPVQSGRLSYDPSTLVPDLHEVDIGPYLRHGENVLAIRAEDEGYIEWALLDAAIRQPTGEAATVIAFDGQTTTTGSDRDFNDLVVEVDVSEQEKVFPAALGKDELSGFSGTPNPTSDVLALRVGPTPATTRYNSEINSLLNTWRYADVGDYPDEPLTINYSIPKANAVWDAGSYAYDAHLTKKFIPVEDPEVINAFKSALQDWSSVANIQFIEVLDSADQQGVIRLARYIDDSNFPPIASAFSPPPYQLVEAPFGSEFHPPSNIGDIWLTQRFFEDVQEFGVDKGSISYLTLMHEIGHALGLQHPHDDYDPSSGRPHDEHALPPDQDWTGASVMSYRPFEDAPTDPGLYDDGLHPSTPMVNDILAIQYLYGANTSGQSGDTIWNMAKMGAQPFLTIYDAGGTDEIELSDAKTFVQINLGSGQLSSIGRNYWYDVDFDGFKESVKPMTLAIAHDGGFGRERIENATGGPYRDSLTGNNGANVLKGNGGADLIYGSSGHDTLHGGEGGDDLFGGLGSDWTSYEGSPAAVVVDLGTGKGSGGDAAGDTLVSIENVLGSSGADTIYGNALANFLDGAYGDDTLDGRAGNDFLRGGIGKDTMEGGADFDTVVYSNLPSSIALTVNLADYLATLDVFLDGERIAQPDQNDHLFNIEGVIGSPNDDVISGDGAGNRLEGMGGMDSLNGLAGNDSLLGGPDRDTMLGGADADQLFGGGGNDLMAGEAGADRLHPGFGDDVLAGGSYGMDDGASDYFEFLPELPYELMASWGTNSIIDFVSGSDELAVMGAKQSGASTRLSIGYEALDSNDDQRIDSTDVGVSIGTWTETIGDTPVTKSSLFLDLHAAQPLVYGAASKVVLFGVETVSVADFATGGWKGPSASLALADLLDVDQGVASGTDNPGTQAVARSSASGDTFAASAAGEPIDTRIIASDIV